MFSKVAHYVKLMKKLILTILLLAITTIGFGQTFTNGASVTKGNGIVHFSNDLVVKTYSNSDFTINSFSQEVFDLDKPPHKLKAINSIFAATLMSGTATVVYSGTNETDSCVISTPFTDVELFKGSFYFKVTENSVIVVVLDGSLKAHGDKKKETDVTKDFALFAVPNDKGIFEDKVSLDAKKVTVDNIKKLSEDVQEVMKEKDSFIFITISGKTVGVNIN